MNIKMLKYMGLLTTCSVFAALTSIIWQAFLSLKQLNRLTTTLTGLLALENNFGSLNNLRTAKRNDLRVAIGYGACTDLVINATEFLNYSSKYVLDNWTPEFTVGEVNDEIELLQTFGYYFQNGAAAERVMTNTTLFRLLIQKAKRQYATKIQWLIGGNAPLMGIRLKEEGWHVLLGATMSKKLRRLVPGSIQVAGDTILENDIHLILEYTAGEKWGQFIAPRANRYILHNDQNNPYLNSLEQLGEQLKTYKPNLFIISGLQMMDSYKFEIGVREARLKKVQEQIIDLPRETLVHFEMASYVEIELLQELHHYVLPYVDSLGMNEQELDNLVQVLEFGKITLASDWNPRIALTLDRMRKVLYILTQEYYMKESSDKRLLSRIHLHTLAYQAFVTIKESKWNNTQRAAAKASLMAYRYVCQSHEINPESALLILDDSFTTSFNQTNAQRIAFNPNKPVACWSETMIVSNVEKTLNIEICVAPVLVCRLAKKTAGAGDNISAAGLSQQF